MMKQFSKITAMVALVLFTASQAFAQLQLPSPSPKGMVKQTVGLTEITVEYSRPSVKGRQIFGALVPYNEMWRTGANMSTTIEFTDDVTVEGQKLAKGKYSLFTIPTQNEWTIIFNKNANLSGTSGYQQSEDALRIKVKPQQGEMTETFTINIDDVSAGGATLELQWDKTRVPVAIKIDTDGKVNNTIANLDGSTSNTYARTANYLMTSNPEQAMQMVDKSIQIKPGYYNHWVKAQLLAAKGNYAEAQTHAQKALDLGEPTDKDKEFFHAFYKGQIQKGLTEYQTKVPAGKKKK